MYILFMSGFDMFSGDSSILPDDIKEYLGQHLEVGNASTKWWSWLNVRWFLFKRLTKGGYVCYMFVYLHMVCLYIYVISGS